MREQKEQEKQNELLRVVAEQNHERLIEYDVKEDRAVVYAIENDRFEVLFDIEDYVKKNHYGSVFIDPEDKKVFRRAMHACLQKEGTVTVDVRYCEKENQPEWYRFYLVSIAEEDGKTDRMVGRFCCVQQEKAITERMRRRAEIDVLTNVYNHKAFEEYCAKELAECTTNALFVMLDIDDFKFINDIYGHVYGDKALRSLADSMKAFFPSDALLGRNGGDEFCILLKNYSYEDVKEKLQQFTMAPKTFSYKGKEYPFYISLGYSEYPTFASNRSQLMRCADAALYEIKLHGKNGCMAYREGLELRVRKQLGFAFRDISEHLPGAFIIYRADKEDDELFYANQEFLHMAGYKDMDELFRLTKKSFSNLIREDEKKKIEASIWKQIDNGNGNDYIHFHLRRADGSYLSVLDHGRIVESQQYGKVFYVLFMDWEDMKSHYSEKFSG